MSTCLSILSRYLPFNRQTPLVRAACSVSVLAVLGALPFSFPTVAQAAGAAIAPNTLPVLRGVVSGSAVVNAPVAGAARSVMTIDQSSQRAILDWRSFNIGSGSEVQFRQPNSTASALNRIYDANPSVIRGKLTANGQVLLINQNGILFDRGAQVNVQSLVASTLNLSNQRFLSGVLTAGGLTTPAFAGGYDELGNTLSARPDGTRPAPLSLGSSGDAASPAPILQAGAGGSVMLIAPGIDNKGGVIRAPDGQVILAAGNKVYLALSDDSSDITLRGFVVEVEAAPDGEGVNLSHLIRNAGDVSADRGNVTLAALAVNQAGRISAKTAVQSNGSIYLTARARVAPVEGEPAGTTAIQAGSVKFEAGSVTEVVPDAADKTTIPDSQSYLPYRGVISVAGRTIENSGTVQAAGGRISLNASDSVDPSSARVYLGAGSTTSVAGAWADVDVKKNVQSLRVTSNELRNSPNQKTSALRGALVTVDLRQDNAILELGGYRGIVARTVAEKAAAGGELQIASSGSVIQRSGAVIDASGGGYRYGAGMVGTTKLLGADGKIYDIATAPEQRRYSALLDRYERTSTRWNQTVGIANPLGALGAFQDAYVQGLSGGLVTINSSAGLVLDGSLLGGVTVGPRQLASAPRGATLRVGEYLQGQRNFAEGQRIGHITVQQRASDTLGAAFGVGTALTTAQRDAFTLSAEQIFGASTVRGPDLAETGFGSVELNANGRIVVAPDAKIVSQVGGELILRSPQIDIAGDIRLPGGTLTVQPVVPSGDPISAELGSVTERVLVRGGADLSTAGTWVNTSNADGSFVGAPVPSGRLVATTITATTANAAAVSKAIDGGNLTFQLDDPLYQTRFERGSSLDVGGGASIASNKRVTGGKGGKLAIANGVGEPSTSDWLQADLRGYAPGTGGELTLGLARAVIGGGAAPGVLPAATTRLGTSLFSDFGFSKITVNAVDGIDITAGTAMRVQQKNWVIDPLSAAQQTSGTAIASFGSLQLLPDAQRSAASVSLAVRGGGQETQPGLNVRDGSSIVTDPRGEVLLSSIGNLAIDGRISAPGGRIGLTLNGPVDLSAADLRIGDSARLSVAGTFVATPNDLGLVQGSVINGGSITLDARRAGLRLDAGSILDVSAVSQTLDVATSGKKPGYTKQTIDGHAGTLTLRSQGRTVLDGSLVGHGGTTAAAGGSFVLESNRADGLSALPDARRIVVTSGNSVVPAEAGISDAALDIAELTASGFEKLRLQSEDRIEFRGSSTLNFERGIRLDAPLIDLTGTSVVTLQGSTVSLGQTLGERQLQSTGDVPVWVMTSGTASPVLATRSGEGELRVKAGSVDLFGSSTVNGTRRTRIESDSDIRLVGRAITFESSSGGQQTSRQTGGLTSAGNLELVAAQITPATRTEYAFAVKDQPSGIDTPDGYIRITGNGRAPSTSYSAGGKVSFSAETITQGGTVRAPLGAIDMKASRLLEFATGSLTSVSGAGVTVPYGTTTSGIIWRYTDGGSAPPETLAAVTSDGKRLTLDAPAVNVRAGATIDLSGGGAVQALEFVPGNGGDNDITLRDNTFAIIPTARLAAMPYDTQTQSQKDVGFGFALGNARDGVLYDSIQIGAGTLVPAGEYTLLPARYALLPDAFLLELQTGSQYRNLQPGQTTTLATGDVVAAGFRTARGTAVRDSQSVGVVVKPGSAARLSSDYTISGAEFFANAAALERRAAPRSPWDAGRLSIDNASSLAFDGTFRTASASSPTTTAARSSEVDIGGARIAVVDRAGGPTPALGADVLQIEGAALSRLNGSVLLGGKRTDTADGIRITTSASEILVANTAAGAVAIPELILAATDRIDVAAGSVLAGTGTGGGTSPEVIASEASGALVRLSRGAQTRIDRGPAASDATGEVRIAQGASLRADTALLVDATRSTESLGQFRVGGTGGAGGSLSLSSVRVNLGDTARSATPLSGLVLSNSDLAMFGSLDQFVLRGYGSIDFIGATQLGSSSLTSLTLDTPLLCGRSDVGGAAPQATLTAVQIDLANSASSVATASTGTGVLQTEAQRLVIGSGSKAVSGFSEVRLAATERVSSQGEGSLRAAAAMTIDAPRVVAQGGSLQTISARDDSHVGAPVYSALVLTGTPPALPVMDTRRTELGGRITLEGQRVTVSNSVEARSGQIAVAARGTAPGDGVTLASGAVLDARGQAKSFNGKVVVADGGSVALSSAEGAVLVGAGARIDVSASDAGGGAGRVSLRGAELTLAGNLRGQAGAGARSGSVDIDAMTLGDFSVLNTALNAGGFAEERQIRQRQGDLRVAATDDVKARRVSLEADAGRIDVAGTLGSGAAGGGARVQVLAGTGVSLDAGSRVLAGGSLDGARGGEVRVAARSGELAFDSDASIDVRAGRGGPAGSVTFGVARDDSNAMQVARVDGTVLRGNTGGSVGELASVDIEATRSYTVATSVSATDIATLATDHADFIAATDAAPPTLGLRDELGALNGARVLGATEVRSAGDLSLANSWNLADGQWLAGGKPGTLTVRAGGNLTVSQSIGLPNDNLSSGDSWSLRLTAGADLQAANPLATRATGLAAGQGNLRLESANAKLRTGTGRIDLAAAGDVSVDNVRATIYTAGRVGVADTANVGRWAVDGGGISVRAGGSLVGATVPAGDLWINEWLRRPRQSNNQFASLQPTDWWSHRPRFQQGVGTLAGGDIDISVGGNISNLAAMLPTSGRTYRDADSVRRVDVQGGGNLAVQAGGDIAGSSFLVGRGTGRVEAGGDIGVGRATQLYVMGASSGDVPERAGIDLVAGGSLALQSINNPTAMFVANKDGSDPATGPSFGNQGSFSTFFTYSANSQAGAVAKSGDLSYAAVLPPAWRTFNSVSPINSTHTDISGSFPASLSMVAFEGDMSGPALIDAVTTFPSASATVSFLAGGSMTNVGFYGSDRDPSTVISPSGSFALANIGARQIDGRTGLRPSGSQRRIVSRDGIGAPYVFELQALEGSFVTGGTATDIVLTGPGRLRAGVDVVGVALRMQNLKPGDVSEVRADTGDFRAPVALEIAGPGRLLVQAGRNVDLGTATLAQGSAGDVGGLVATGNNGNTQLPFADSARITVVAGASGPIDVNRMDAAYTEIIALNGVSADIIDLYRQLGTEPDASLVTGAASIAALAARDPVYARFVALDQKAPRALAAYKAAIAAQELPLGPTADSTAAADLYSLLNSETDVARLQQAGSIAALANAPGGAAYQAYVGLDQRYPKVFADYVQRRGKGALPTGVTPIVFSNALAEVVAQVVPRGSVSGGNITSYQTSIQTYGASDIDLWAPGGDIVVGLTTPRSDKTVGVLTNSGGAVRSVLSGDFNINQGKVITAQGGDILLFSSQGSIDAGRGAKTTVATPAPRRRPILDAEGNQVGVEVTIPAGATGSGIQTLSSDPDGLGPLAAAKAGDVYLFAPAGTIDAGEAGIRSSGNIVINAQTVLNGSNISVAGSSAGVPVAATGSLATSLAGSGTANNSKAAEEAAASATNAARAAAAAEGLQKPTILTVEVLGFGDKNCKEQDKGCLAK